MVDIDGERLHVRAFVVRPQEQHAGGFDHPVGNVLIDKAAAEEVNDLDVPVGGHQVADGPVGRQKHFVGLELETDTAPALRIEHDVVQEPLRVRVPIVA